eukprot:7625429-Heterocapsa_arctica.AAC.1
MFPETFLVDPVSGLSRIACGGNFDLLGAAIGDKLQREAFAQRRATAAADLMRLLPAIGDPQ